MSFKVEERRPFRAPCACGQGFVRYYKVYEINEFGHERESETPMEIHCDFCKSLYNLVQTPYVGVGDLIPKGISKPIEVPALDRKYRLTGDESFIREHSREVVVTMIEDMENHKFLDRLEYEPAIRYADEWYLIFKKKSLKPMISDLRRILSEYDSIETSYLKKKPFVDAHEALVDEYHRKNAEIISKTYPLSFEFDEEQYQAERQQMTNQKATSEKDKQSEHLPWNVYYHDSCKVDSTGYYWDTLYIKECIDPHCMIEKKVFSTITEKIIVKKYLCKCKLCLSNVVAYSSDFEILYEDGRGFYPAIQCSCHKVSSFEAKTMGILFDHGIVYEREVSIEGLVGDSGRPLRFDFALFGPSNKDGKRKIRLLLELQGPHHFKQGIYDDNGVFVEDRTQTSIYAKTRADKQTRYDEIKRLFCKENNISLEIIKYTSSSISKLEEQITCILRKYGLDDSSNNQNI